MSKFVKTIDLWANGNEQAIRDGSLKIQRGQWVTCGPEGIKSRFVSVDGYSVNVAHGCTYKEVIKRFMERCEYKKQAAKSR